MKDVLRQIEFVTGAQQAEPWAGEVSYLVGVWFIQCTWYATALASYMYART